MIHLYWGDGKGKTTAAMGLALRALGHGLCVTVVQFLKDGSSGEIAPLRTLGAAVFTAPCARFTWQMDEADRLHTRAQAGELLRRATERPCDLLLLDEACGICAAGLLDETLLRQAIAAAQGDVVLTGRDPAAWMRQCADYSTELRAERHPYDKGVAARPGIEF